MRHKVAIALDRSCAAPGDTQGMTVIGAPQSFVSYDSVYVDGKGGLTGPRHGGSGNGKSDDRGVFRAAWVLAPNVPAGNADVNAIGSDGEEPLMVTARFLVALPGQPC